MSTTEDRDIAEVQLDAGDQSVRMPEDKRAKKTEEGLIAELKGEEFLISEEIGAMALMEWAAAADLPVGSSKGLSAIYHILECVVDEDDWNTFTTHARKTKADPEELLDFLNAAMEAIAGRPTPASSSSEDGRAKTSGASTARSSAAARRRVSKR